MKANLTARLFRRFLDQDAQRRELSIVKIVLWLMVFGAGVSLSLVGFVGWTVVFRLLLFTGCIFAYYAIQYIAIRRGLFHPILQWTNVMVESLLLVGVLLINYHHRGVAYAMTSPTLLGWPIAVMLSGLRGRRRLSVFAGCCAASGFLLANGSMIQSGLPDDLLPTLTPSYTVLRALLLLVAGLVTAVVAGHIVENAESALARVRERELFSKYILHESIGAGGMAEVFRATYCPQGGFEKEVAVKRIHRDHTNDQAFRALFVREAEISSRLNHPGIVQVFDLGEEGGSYFLAMELVEGTSLAAILKNNPRGLPLTSVIHLGVELAGALDYVHHRSDARGNPLDLVHRDVNPPNVLVSRAGDVKLADFGIAGACTDEPKDGPGRLSGKLSYMAPEQARGEATDSRSDLFALGLTLYETLLGSRKETKSPISMLLDSVSSTLPPPSEIRGEISPELDAAVMKLLAPERTVRTQTGDAARRELMTIGETMGAFPHGKEGLGAAVVAIVGSSSDLK